MQNEIILHSEFCIYHDERNDRMAQSKGLGKGLGALLGDFSEESYEPSAYRELPLYKVEPNPDQPRKAFDETALAKHGSAHFKLRFDQTDRVGVWAKNA